MLPNATPVATVERHAPRVVTVSPAPVGPPDWVVTVLLHEIDTATHPDNPPGWRWCVHQTRGQPTAWHGPGCGWLNAGWTPNRGEAGMEGEAVGTAVATALRRAGHAVAYALVELDHDPIPADPAEQQGG